MLTATARQVLGLASWATHRQRQPAAERPIDA